jgi:undecaprenyl-diphosphatase
MKWATHVGDGHLWVVLAMFLWLMHRDGVLLIQTLGLAYAMERTLYKVGKAAFGRPRPFVVLPDVDLLVVPPDEFSFPSGHTAAAFVMATVAGAFFPEMLVVLVPLAALVGMSRVYLGVHYPSDVLAGALLGVASGFCALTLM